MREKKKSDNSAYVPQRDKVRKTFNIKEFDWNDKQQSFIKLALDKKVKVLLVEGPAGTSKTLLSVFILLQLLKEKKISDIIYSRAAVESADSKIGYLPGDVDDKLKYYSLPLLDKLTELLSEADINLLLKENRIVTYPVNFARGMSWSVKGIILDEAQNNTFSEIKTILTRVGEFSKVIICADSDQSDIQASKAGGFARIFQLFSNTEAQNNGIYTFKFDEDDIVRSQLVKFIVKTLKGQK